MRWPLLLLLLAACSPNGQGIGVGNPGEAVIRLAPPGLGEVSSATVVFGGWTGSTCRGEEWEDLMSIEVDLLQDNVPLPAYRWCTVRLLVESPLSIELTAEGMLTAELPLGELALDQTAVGAFPENTFIELGDPGWAEDVELEVGINRVLLPDDPEAVELARRLDEGFKAVADDGDGVLTDEERRTGRIVGGSNCSTAPRLLSLASLLRRRSPTRVVRP